MKLPFFYKLSILLYNFKLFIFVFVVTFCNDIFRYLFKITKTFEIYYTYYSNCSFNNIVNFYSENHNLIAWNNVVLTDLIGFLKKIDRIGGLLEKIGSDRWPSQKNWIGSIFPIRSNRSDPIVLTPCSDTIKNVRQYGRKT